MNNQQVIEHMKKLPAGQYVWIVVDVDEPKRPVYGLTGNGPGGVVFAGARDIGYALGAAHQALAGFLEQAAKLMGTEAGRVVAFAYLECVLTMEINPTELHGFSQELRPGEPESRGI